MEQQTPLDPKSKFLSHSLLAVHSHTPDSHDAAGCPGVAAGTWRRHSGRATMARPCMQLVLHEWLFHGLPTSAITNAILVDGNDMPGRFKLINFLLFFFLVVFSFS